MISALLKCLIRLYQILLSPILAAVGVSCRFYPSCSRYAMACVNENPWPVALRKIIRRLAKCGPWHPGGVDLP